MVSDGQISAETSLVVYYVELLSTSYSGCELHMDTIGLMARDLAYSYIDVL